MFSASTGPIPCTSWIASGGADRSAVTDPKCLSRTFIRAAPRPGTSARIDVMSFLRRLRWCVIANRCASVPQSLEQVERLTGARQDHREVIPGEPDLLEPLGDAAHGDLGVTGVSECPRGRLDLRLPAIDEQQLRRIGEAGLALDLSLIHI